MATQNIVNGWRTTFVANNSSGFQITNIPSTINTVMIMYSNVSISASTLNLMVQLSTNNGSSYIATGYFSGQVYFAYNGASPSNQSLTSGIQLGFLIGSGGSPISYSSGTTFLYNLNSAFAVTSTGNTCWTANNTQNLFGISGGQLGGTTNVNAFQIIMTSGNISTGTFKIYGFN